MAAAFPRIKGTGGGAGSLATTLTRREDAATPVEARAIPLPTVRVLVIRARVRIGWLTLGHGHRSMEVSRLYLRRVSRKAANLGDWSSGNEGWKGVQSGQGLGLQAQTCAASWAVPCIYFPVGLPPGLWRTMRVETCFGFMPAPDCAVPTGNPYREGKSGSWAVLGHIVCVCMCVCCPGSSLGCYSSWGPWGSRAVGLEKTVGVSRHSLRL